MKGQVLEAGFAEALPTEQRLERFQRLAKLQPSRVAAFNYWAKERELSKEQKEVAQESWNAAWLSMKVDDLFNVVKRLAVFDESFRLPQLKAGSEEFRGNVEDKFGKLMLAVSLLALEIQREYEKHENVEEKGDVTCLQ